MRDDERLTRAIAAKLKQSIAHTLNFDGRRHFSRGDNLMAQIVAQHIEEHPARCQWVIMKKPPGPMYWNAGRLTE